MKKNMMLFAILGLFCASEGLVAVGPRPQPQPNEARPRQRSGSKSRMSCGSYSSQHEKPPLSKKRPSGGGSR